MYTRGWARGDRCGRGLTKSRWNRFPDTTNRNRFPRRDLRCVSWSDIARDAAVGHLVPNCPPSPRTRQVVHGVGDSRDTIPQSGEIPLRCRLAVTRNAARARRTPFRGPHPSVLRSARLCCRRFSRTSYSIRVPTPTHRGRSPRGTCPCDKDSHLEQGTRAWSRSGIH